MIGAAGNINPLAAGELVPRQPRPDNTGASVQQEEVNLAGSRGDAVSLSAEAIALARAVPPAGEASETGGEERRETRSDGDEGARGGKIDIRA
jgi:hypothetical protein